MDYLPRHEHRGVAHASSLAVVRAVLRLVCRLCIIIFRLVGANGGGARAGGEGVGEA